MSYARPPSLPSVLDPRSDPVLRRHWWDAVVVHPASLLDRPGSPPAHLYIVNSSYDPDNPPPRRFYKKGDKGGVPGAPKPSPNEQLAEDVSSFLALLRQVWHPECLSPFAERLELHIETYVSCLRFDNRPQLVVVDLSGRLRPLNSLTRTIAVSTRLKSSPCLRAILKPPVPLCSRDLPATHTLSRGTLPITSGTFAPPHLLSPFRRPSPSLKNTIEVRYLSMCRDVCVVYCSLSCKSSGRRRLARTSTIGSAAGRRPTRAQPSEWALQPHALCTVTCGRLNDSRLRSRRRPPLTEQRRSRALGVAVSRSRVGVLPGCHLYAPSADCDLKGLQPRASGVVQTKCSGVWSRVCAPSANWTRKRVSAPRLGGCTASFVVPSASGDACEADILGYRCPRSSRRVGQHATRVRGERSVGRTAGLQECIASVYVGSRSVYIRKRCVIAQTKPARSSGAPASSSS